MSPALAGSASTAQSPRHLPFAHFTSRHFRHLTSHHLTSSRTVLFLSTDQSELPHRTRHTTRLTQTHGAPAPGHLARGAGHQRPITGRGAPTRPGPDLAPGATRSRWPAEPPRGPAGEPASAARQRSVATSSPTVLQRKQHTNTHASDAPPRLHHHQRHFLH